MKHVLRSLVLVAASLIAVTTACAAQQTQSASDVLERAINDFLAGRITESVEGFDTVVKLAPNYGPGLWQRGIALYYAGRYKDCRAQFELHRTVNPNDVENAVWHFLCVARAESPDKARAAILPVGPDSRTPMKEVYEMFRGALKPEDILKAGQSRPESEFYAELYVGLYFEATGEAAKAREHIAKAAADRFARAGGYMHEVARIHVARLTK